MIFALGLFHFPLRLINKIQMFALCPFTELLSPLLRLPQIWYFHLHFALSLLLFSCFIVAILLISLFLSFSEYSLVNKIYNNTHIRMIRRLQNPNPLIRLQTYYWNLFKHPFVEQYRNEITSDDNEYIKNNDNIKHVHIHDTHAFIKPMLSTLISLRRLPLPRIPFHSLTSTLYCWLNS